MNHRPLAGTLNDGYLHFPLRLSALDLPKFAYKLVAFSNSRKPHMPASKKGKIRHKPSPLHAQRSKMLYLPMPRADVDDLMLRSRIALEAVRHGYANGPAARRLASVMLLTRFLTEAGHGQLERDELDNAERTLADIFAVGDETDIWSFPAPAIDMLTRIVNEHERQLFGTRLEAVAAASTRLDGLIEKHGTALRIRLT